MKIRLSEIPFRCDTYREAIAKQAAMIEARILTETRGDELALLCEDDNWYVLVRTGNLRGMIRDLEEARFM